MACVLGWRPIRMIRTAESQENLIHLAIFFPMVGGLFGFSVLTMAILPLLIFISVQASDAYQQVSRNFRPKT